MFFVKITSLRCCARGIRTPEDSEEPAYLPYAPFIPTCAFLWYRTNKSLIVVREGFEPPKIPKNQSTYHRPHLSRLAPSFGISQMSRCNRI